MFRGFLSEFKTTGTAFNSSRWAAQALSQPVRSAHLRSKKVGSTILEVGAGTGPVTIRIVEDMGPEDSLTVVELNGAFMKALQERLEKSPHYQKHKDRIRLFVGPIQDLPEDVTYDVIVCALPFLNFERPLVEDIFKKFRRLGSESTILTYYEYIGLRKLGKLVSPKRKERVEELEDFFQHVGHRRLIGREKVWLNFLPISVYTIKLPELH